MNIEYGLNNNFFKDVHIEFKDEPNTLQRLKDIMNDGRTTYFTKPIILCITFFNDQVVKFELNNVTDTQIMNSIINF